MADFPNLLICMDYFKLCDKGFEHMASVPTYDDAYDATEQYMESSCYSAYAITRYKRFPGQEDAYAILVLPKLRIYE